MIWTSDAAGATIYTSIEWEQATGQSPEAARGLGWLSMIHPEDRTSVSSIVDRGAAEACDYWSIHRVAFKSGYRWVLAGATAAPSMDAKGCIGFLGSFTKLERHAALVATAELGTFRSGPARRETLPVKSHLQMLHDLQMVALSLAQDARESAIVDAVGSCLSEIERQMVDKPLRFN